MMRTTESPTSGNEPDVLPDVPAGEPRKGPGIEPGTLAEDDLDETPALPKRIPDWARQSVGREGCERSIQ